jgi:pyridoxamine 5'-phosphate oxidase
MRKEYTHAALHETDMARDPVTQFATWFQEAVAADVPEPNAMTLATSTPDGKPSARIVLLKHYDDRGFTFHTNYESRKGREIEANPFVALVFFWHALERQVRIEGRVERTSEAESDNYFQTRPVGARLGAWASKQSGVIPDRKAMEARLRELEEDYRDGNIPRPPHWGGFRVEPLAIEFWQGRANRLHDRFQYVRMSDGDWKLDRLAP